MKRKLFIFIPVLVYAYFLLFYLYDYPFADDFRVVIRFFQIYSTQINVIDKIKTLFIAENESYPVFQRLIIIGIAKFNTNMSIKYGLILCNSLLIIITYIFFKKTEKLDYLASFICFSLLFSIANHQLFYRYDVASYQSLTVYFSIISIYLASKEKLSLLNKIIIWSLLFLAPFNSANGIFLTLVIMGIFLFKKEKINFYITILVGLVIVIILSLLDNPSDKSLGFFDNLIKHDIKILFAFFIGIGSFISLPVNNLGFFLSGFIGLIVLILNLYFLYFYRNQKIGFNIGLFLFGLGNVAALALLRYNYWIIGYVSMVESRYKIYGALLVINIFLLYLPKNKSKYLLLVFFVLVYLLNLYKSHFVLFNQKMNQITDSYNVKPGKIIKDNIVTYMYVPDNELKELMDEGFYKFDKPGNILATLIDKKADLLPVSSVKIIDSPFDETKNSDFGRYPFYVKNIKVNGGFKYYNYYFCKIIGNNNVDIIIPLYGGHNMYSYFFKPKKYDSLAWNCYLDFFNIQKPYKVKIYGLNSLN